MPVFLIFLLPPHLSSGAGFRIEVGGEGKGGRELCMGFAQPALEGGVSGLEPPQGLPPSSEPSLN